MATYTLINSNTLAATATSVTFSSIPATYTDLMIVMSTRTTSTTGGSGDLEGYLSINGSTSGYSYITLYGSGSAAGSGIGATYPPYVDDIANATSNTFSSSRIHIPSYVASKNKPQDIFSTPENNVATSVYMYKTAGLWNINDPITSLTFTPYNGSYVIGSSFYLYGIFNGPETLPTTPTIGTASNGQTGTTASVAFTELSNNVAASYTVTSTPGSFTATGTKTPVTVRGLTPSTSYTFTIKANNPGGSSANSSASNSVSPTLVNSGYFAGGDSPTLNTVWRLNFTSDALTIPPVTLSQNKAAMGSASNNGTAGYWGGGLNYSYGFTNVIDKILFNSDVRSTLTTTLALTNRYLTGFSNSGTAGYFIGGMTDTNALQTSYQKLLYSGETISTVASLPVARRSMGAASNNGTAGYVAGGWDGSSATNTIQKLVFSSDTRSQISATITTSTFTIGGCANSGTAGYFFGASLGGTVRKLAFSNDTVSTVSATLATGYTYATSASNNGTSGYLTGSSADISKLAFSNDTNTTLTNIFGTTITDCAGLANTASL